MSIVARVPKLKSILSGRQLNIHFYRLEINFQLKFLYEIYTVNWCCFAITKIIVPETVFAVNTTPGFQKLAVDLYTPKSTYTRCAFLKSLHFILNSNSGSYLKRVCVFFPCGASLWSNFAITNYSSNNIVLKCRSATGWLLLETCLFLCMQLD